MNNTVGRTITYAAVDGVNSTAACGELEHGRQWIRSAAGSPLGIITSQLFLQLPPGNQLIHVLKKALAASFGFLALVLDFGEGHLIHCGNAFHAVGDGRIIADSVDLLICSLRERCFWFFSLASPRIKNKIYGTLSS